MLIRYNGFLAAGHALPIEGGRENTAFAKDVLGLPFGFTAFAGGVPAIFVAGIAYLVPELLFLFF